MSEKEKPTGLALLRVPFPPNTISKLPKPTVSNEEWKKLPRAKCNECGGWHPITKTIHLDYVGHAALTDRLLDCDPAWTWEPLALDASGLPMLDRDGGMWIKLTICGVTRYGYGDAQGKTGGNAVKERIGDALRNAAMRFGAALELWHKGDLHADDEDGTVVEAKAAPVKDTLQHVVRANVKPTAGLLEQLDEETRKRVEAVASECIDCMEVMETSTAYDVIEEAQFDADQKAALWSLLGSGIRSALKKEHERRRKAELIKHEHTQA